MPGLAPRIVALIAVSACMAACGGGSSSTSSAASSSASTTTTGTATATATATAASGPTPGPEGIPLEHGPPLASASTTGTGTVDGIRCAPLEQLAYHIHAHLAVYVDGSLRALPAGIGIPGALLDDTPYGPFAVSGQCFYWLHTHASDGVIHIESPTATIYSLGEFFDEWHQPLGPDQVATARGPVTAIVNGKIWSKNPRSIPLVPHLDIQLDVGSPKVPFQPVSWAGTDL